MYFTAVMDMPASAYRTIPSPLCSLLRISTFLKQKYYQILAAAKGACSYVTLACTVGSLHSLQHALGRHYIHSLHTGCGTTLPLQSPALQYHVPKPTRMQQRISRQALMYVWSNAGYLRKRRKITFQAVRVNTCRWCSWAHPTCARCRAPTCTELLYQQSRASVPRCDMLVQHPTAGTPMVVRCQSSMGHHAQSPAQRHTHMHNKAMCLRTCTGN